jgi:nicotinamide riboside transporter PnuC
VHGDGQAVMSEEPSEAKARTSREPKFLRIRSWSIGLVVSMVLTCMFVQFVNDWLDNDLATLDVERTHQPVSDTEIFQNHAHLVMWTRVAIIVFAISAVLWLVWQYQAHANARALGRPRRSLPPVLGLLAWAIPVANVVLVPLAMGSLFLASDPEQGSSNRAPRWYVLLVLLWWGLFATGVWMIGSAVLSTPTAHASFTQLIDRDTRARAGSYFLFLSALAAAAVVAAIDVRLQAKDARVSFERGRRGWTSYQGPPASGSR